jgi:hypothetical protein
MAAAPHTFRGWIFLRPSRIIGVILLGLGRWAKRALERAAARAANPSDTNPIRRRTQFSLGSIGADSHARIPLARGVRAVMNCEVARSLLHERVMAGDADSRFARASSTSTCAAAATAAKNARR